MDRATQAQSTPSNLLAAEISHAAKDVFLTEQNSPARGHAWRALRHRNFRLFIGGQSISLIGTWMTRIATSWLVYRLTGSALLLGTIGFVGQIPTFLFAPFAGVWVDRSDRHKVLIATQAALMAQALLLAVLTLTHLITVPILLVLSALQGLINAFDMPARQSFMIRMIDDRADLSNAIAINSSMVNMTRLIGPSIAGILIAVTGEGLCFLIDGLSYAAVLTSLFLMCVAREEPHAARGSALGQLKDGWSYVSRFRPIRAILLLFALVSLMGMPYLVLMPIFAAEVLHGGAHTMGFLMAASGIGALISSLMLMRRRNAAGLERAIPLASLIFGVGLVGFGCSSNFWLSMLLVMIAGGGMILGLAASNTVIQTIVSEQMRGRVMSYYTMAFIGMAPFGSLLAGSMAHHIGAQKTVMINGAIVILGALIFYARLKVIDRDTRPIYERLGFLAAENESSIDE